MPTYQLYEDLGLQFGASSDEIKKAYRKLALSTHPDRGGDPEKFKKISNAYQILSDEQKRGLYDQVGDEQFQDANAGMQHHGGMGGIDPEILFQNIFSQFDFGGGGHHPFGGGPPPPKRRNDHVHHIKMTLAEAFHGTRKNVRISLQKSCLSSCCSQTCFRCQGRGSITDMRRMGFMTQMMTRPCDGCQATGKILKPVPDCSECKGKGKYTTDVAYELHIPNAVSTGHRIVCQGYGEQPQIAGEIAGDLIIEIIIHGDTNFQRQGNDLVHTVKLSFAESIIGKNIVVPHFEKPIELFTADYGVLQPNKPYIIQGKGMTKDSNLILLFQIDYPTRIFTEEERTQLQGFFEQTGLWSKS